MKRLFKLTSLFLVIASFSLLLGCTKQQAKPVTLNISAAASLKDSLDEVKKIYTDENTNVKLIINYGSSGTLQQQIEQGADVDIFISAAAKQMDALQSKDLINKESKINLLLNDIVLVVPKDTTTIKCFDDITSDKTKKIALGEPKSVPAGQYAEQVFTKLCVVDKIKAKAVYGKDVKEVLTWVETGNADAGIVYSSDAKVSTKIQVVATAPADSHDPVVYPTAVIKSSKNNYAANKFMKFLTSDKAKSVFEKYGFKTGIK